MLKLKLVRFLFLTPVLDHGKVKYVLNFKETVSFILHLLCSLRFVQNKFWVVFYPPEMHMITSTLPNDSIDRYLKNKTFKYGFHFISRSYKGYYTFTLVRPVLIHRKCKSDYVKRLLNSCRKYYFDNYLNNWIKIIRNSICKV